METPYQILCFILFILEGFLVLAHLHVALSMRALPLKDMARLQYFFLFATLTIATTSQAVTSQAWPLDTLQMFHYLYIYMRWNATPYTKKVVEWSSLNWKGTRASEGPLFVGALCVAALHGYHVYLLVWPLDTQLFVLGVIGVYSALMAVMYNSRLAWASPGNVPDWVAKRVAESNKAHDESKSKKSMKHD